MTWYWLAVGALASGALIGFTGGVLGIGGGLLAIPLLGLILGMDQQQAQGTALIMVLPAVLLTVRKYNQNARIDFRAAGAGAAGSIVFTYLGARIALGLDSSVLRTIYASFVLAIAIFYFIQGVRGMRASHSVTPRRQPGEFNRAWFALVGVLAGLAGGVFGVGGSVLVVPILTTVFRLSQTGAQALALTMIIPGTFVALITYASHGQADWLVGVPMAMGSLLCVPYGVRLAYALPEPRLKLIFACMLVVIMGLLLLKV
ncbi:sulfite exporter TauE/SafE family protein [Pusillimonas sp. ANT_WB101]|uniref:sulfite exporter TauE/SafE family protein n=1 Tax=Pusillimonas sp. ANT_WB101 TaxID=2597356 RepID=UPI0011EDC293|nr:sulfite exporter TauE/SafE family protein [Pusillimonas sp. ANT_WB101]KAA0888468.1 sulfite exporter TauE/SafE family protein [Pusillimonas sp. ANT_WB101]